jgi:sterol desaturase/sphingolipid hydroxylase (fatty acid hydroxylase superfamily)
MESFVQLLTSMPDWQRFGVIPGILILAIVLENLFPLFRFNYRQLQHVAVNLIFLMTSGVVSLALAFVAFDWLRIETWQFGLLHHFNFPLWVQLVISIAVLDLICQYWIHAILHKYKWMWKLHLVHHSDTTVDASTGTRHHPGDFFLRELLTITVVFLVGIPVAFYVLYRLLTPLFTYITHANIKVPVGIDRAISWVLVTPNMHKVHHHFERPWTNSNYGNIFSVWDRLFGTFAYVSASELNYGVDTLDNSQDMKLGYQFALPFNPNIKTDY